MPATAARCKESGRRNAPALSSVPFGADVVPEADVGPGADGIARGDHGAFGQVWGGDAAGGERIVGQALEPDELETAAESEVEPATAQ